VVPNYIIQDASYAETNTALSVFGSAVTILMCWFHSVFNVKKHESLAKVSQELRDMVLTDLTRLHYCLEYEYEPFKSIISCTCRWFMAFAVCAHLIAACDFYNHELKGYRQAKDTSDSSS